MWRFTQHLRNHATSLCLTSCSQFWQPMLLTLEQKKHVVDAGTKQKPYCWNFQILYRLVKLVTCIFQSYMYFLPFQRCRWCDFVRLLVCAFFNLFFECSFQGWTLLHGCWLPLSDDAAKRWRPNRVSSSTMQSHDASFTRKNLSLAKILSLIFTRSEEM